MKTFRSDKMGALKVSIYSFLLFGFVSVLSVSLSNEEFETDVIVETTTGLVQGEQGGFIGYSDNPWYRFRKIPYAEPPLGFLRFEVYQKYILRSSVHLFYKN